MTVETEGYTFSKRSNNNNYDILRLHYLDIGQE